MRQRWRCLPRSPELTASLETSLRRRPQRAGCYGPTQSKSRPYAAYGTADRSSCGLSMFIVRIEITRAGHSCDDDLPPDGTSRRLRIFRLRLARGAKQNGDDVGLGNQLVQEPEPVWPATRHH